MIYIITLVRGINIMAIIISTSKQEKVFTDKDMINVGTNPNCDFRLDFDFDLLLTIQNDRVNNRCTIINTFLESCDLRGKTVVPFATSGGSGMGNTAENLKPSCRGATVLKGKRFSANADLNELKQWLKSIL